MESEADRMLGCFENVWEYLGLFGESRHASNET